MAALERIDPAAYRAFQLVAVAGGEVVAATRTASESISSPGKPQQPVIFTSSSLGDSSAELMRVPLFQAMVVHAEDQLTGQRLSRAPVAALRCVQRRDVPCGRANRQPIDDRRARRHEHVRLRAARPGRVMFAVAVALIAATFVSEAPPVWPPADRGRPAARICGDRRMRLRHLRRRHDAVGDCCAAGVLGLGFAPASAGAHRRGPPLARPQLRPHYSREPPHQARGFPFTSPRAAADLAVALCRMDALRGVVVGHLSWSWRRLRPRGRQDGSRHLCWS